MAFLDPSFWIRFNDWVDEGLVPDWARDSQARSRATRERILEETVVLLAERPFAEITMQDIAEGASISIGALYARFPSKEAVLVMLGVVTLDNFRRKLVEAIDVLPPASGSLRPVIQTYVSLVVDELQRNRRLITEVRRHAGAVPSLNSLAAHTNRAIHEAFLQKARSFSHEIDHHDVDEGLNYALFLVNAAAREAILSGALSVYPVPGERDDLVEELTRMVCRYLGAGEL